METVERSIVINAPVAKVFEYIDDPMNDAEWMMGMVEVHEVEGLPGGVVDAQGGKAHLAEATSLNRETLYRTLSEN